MRKVVVPVLVIVLCLLCPRPRRSEGVGSSFVFPLSVSGKIWVTDIAFGPGFKIKPSKINDKAVGAILRGENTDDVSIPFLDLLHSDPSGRFFIYFDGRNLDGSVNCRFATNPNGIMTTAGHGAMTQDGVFWLAGTYQLPVLGTLADAFATGKMKFAKGTFSPVKISGTLSFTSVDVGYSFTVKFKTVGKPLLVP